MEKIKEKKHVNFIQVVFDIIQNSKYLQNEIIKNIGKNIDYNIISKKYFIEAIMKSMMDNDNNNPIIFTRNISYSYNA